MSGEEGAGWDDHSNEGNLGLREQLQQCCEALSSIARNLPLPGLGSESPVPLTSPASVLRVASGQDATEGQGSAAERPRPRVLPRTGTAIYVVLRM